MRILLVQPWLGRKQHPVLPLGLACIAGSLSSHRVSILDLNMYLSPLEKLRGVLLEFKPDAVGFSLRNADTTSYFDRHSYIPSSIMQIEIVSSVCPDVFIIAGGGGFSVFARQIMSVAPGLHCGVTGHGELVVNDLIEHRAKGLYHGYAGSFVAPELNLIDTGSYTHWEKNLALGVEINRGCSLSCRYCSYSAISGNIVRERSLDSVREDITKLVSAGAGHLFLVAPLLNSTRQRGMETAAMIESLHTGLTWEAYHSPLGFDMEYASAIRSSGCTAVSFSPDGGTDGQMKRMGKNYGCHEVEAAVEAAAALGIKVSVGVFPFDIQGGISCMIRSFRNGNRWGKLAGENLRRLRFSLVRRLPDTEFAPGRISQGRTVSRNEFVRPSYAGMIVFTALKKLYERNLQST